MKTMLIGSRYEKVSGSRVSIGDALKTANSRQPQVIVMRESFLVALQDLRRAAPRAQIIVVVTMLTDKIIDMAKQNGVFGIVEEGNSRLLQVIVETGIEEWEINRASASHDRRLSSN